MEVIAIKSTKTLMEGKKYEVEKVDHYYSQIHSWYVEIEGIPNSFDIEGFTTLSGQPIPKEKYKSDKSWYTKMLAIREAQIGDILICESKKLKTLTYGKYYTVADIRTNAEGKTVEVSLKESTKGENFFYQAWYNNFSVLPKDKKRDINIDLVLDDERVKEMKDYYDPIFANMEKESMVLHLIHKSLKYLYETKVNATLQEIIEHRVQYEKYITMEDVEKFDLKKIMKY